MTKPHMFTQFVGVLLFCAAVLCSSWAWAQKPFPEIALFELEGDSLVESGFRDGIQRRYPDARFYVYNAGGDLEVLEALAESARSAKHHLFYASGTAAAQLLLKKFPDKPVIFTNVQSPVKNGLIASWKSSENNSTGISSRLPLLSQLKALKRIVPFRRLGVIFNPRDADASEQVHELERLGPFLGFELKKIELSAPSALEQITPEILAQLDAVALPSDPVLRSGGSLLMKRLLDAKLPTLAADMMLVTRHGALLGLVPDNYQAGRLAALNAVSVLEGHSPTSVPSRSLDYFKVVINMNTARTIGVQVPFSLLVIADTIVR